MKARYKTFALQGLLACDGLPMPASALLAHLANAVRPRSFSVAEAESALRELETEHWIAAATDDLTGETSYTLTAKGKHKAIQL